MLIIEPLSTVLHLFRNVFRGWNIFSIDLHPDVSEENAYIIVDRLSLAVYFYEEQTTVKKVLLGRLTKQTVKELDAILINGKKAFNFNT